MKTKVVIGIYTIKNIVNDKVYVGSSVDIYRRWRLHKHKLSKGVHANRKLQNAWNKYGVDGFKFFVIEELSNSDLLVVREQFWIDAFKAVKLGYNIRELAQSNIGMKHSEESRRKISEAGRRPCKEETRLKISATMKGRKFSRDTIEKRKATMAIVNATEETKRRRSESAKARIFTERQKQNMSAATRNVWESRKLQKDKV